VTPERHPLQVLVLRRGPETGRLQVLVKRHTFRNHYLCKGAAPFMSLKSGSMVRKGSEIRKRLADFQKPIERQARGRAARVKRRVTVGRSLLLVATILTALLIFAGNIAFAQKKNPAPPRPTAGISAEWERMLEGLQKAKPMPEPKHAVTPHTATPHGGLVTFDPKTGVVSGLPPVGAPAAPGLQRKEPKPATQPTDTNGQKATPIPGGKDGVGQLQAVRAAVQALATVPGPLYYPYSFPWNTIARLLLRFNDGTSDYYYLCSASTASDFHMISAGHCVYNHDIRNDGSNIAGWAQEVWAWGAETDVVDPVDHINWPDFPYGVAKMTYEVTYNNWINNSDLNWDFSFITLDRRLGDHTGWMGREWGVTTNSLNFDGYPAEAPYVPSDNPFQYPGFDNNNVLGYTCCRIQMSAYTYGGHSGGPDWRYDGTNDYVEGVNSTSNRTGYAEATLLTSQIETDLENQISSDQTARPPSNLAQVIEYVFNGSSKGLGQTSTQIGYTFPLTLNAFNAGYSDAGDTTADIYLTSDPNNITGGTFIGAYDFGYLGTYSFTVQTPNITIPTHVTPGTYYVGYVLNAANAQYGTDKNAVVITNQTMNAYCNSDVYEPDNAWYQASSIASGGLQNHTICPQADQDWATFSVPFSSAATISTEGFIGGDTTMTLYNSNLNQIDFNDDNGVDLYSTINRTCGTNPLAPGTYYVQIQSYRNASIIPYYTLSVNTHVCPASTSTSLVSSLNPSVYSQSVKFTATVTSGGSTPAGSVTFYDGASAIGTGSLSGGKASFTTSSLSGGAHSITAVYGGHSPWVASTSPVLTQTVSKAASSTRVSSSANPSVFGKNVTITATVTSTAGTPTGTITFKNGSATLGTAALSGGIAEFTTATLPPGVHSITAEYGGSEDFQSSGSGILTETITKTASITSVTSSLNPSQHNQTVTFTAAVKSSTSGTPTGSVTFKNGTSVLGTVALTAGKAKFATPGLPVGTHSITAVYGGDMDFTGSTSPVLTQKVNP